MQQGQKLKDSEGNQVACFPSEQIRITQGENTNYSHFGTWNVDNAVDSPSKRKLYAPVDVRCVSVLNTGYGLVLYQSVEPVLLANGEVDYFSMWLMHDNNYSMWQEGRIYEQGEHIYTEGNLDASGMTTGIHVHYEVAQGLHSQRTISVVGGGYHIVNQSHIDDIFYKNLTEVIRENAPGADAGQRVFNFKEFEGGVIPPEPTQMKGLPIWLLGQKIR